MKKIFAVVFVLFGVFVCSFNNNFLINMLSMDPMSKISFYCAQKNDIDYLSVQKNGDAFVYEVFCKDAKEIISCLKGCYGFSVKLGVDMTETFLKKMTILKTENLPNMTCFYGRVNGLTLFDFLDNKKINIQIAVCQDYIVVGSPIILGWY